MWRAGVPWASLETWWLFWNKLFLHVRLCHFHFYFSNPLFFLHHSSRYGMKLEVMALLTNKKGVKEQKIYWASRLFLSTQRYQNKARRFNSHSPPNSRKAFWWWTILWASRWWQGSATWDGEGSIPLPLQLMWLWQANIHTLSPMHGKKHFIVLVHILFPHKVCKGFAVPLMIPRSKSKTLHWILFSQALGKMCTLWFPCFKCVIFGREIVTKNSIK